MPLYLHPRQRPGICDRCRQRYPYDTLREEYVRGKGVGNLVCQTCWDDDHPQNWVGSIPVGDKQSIEDARPEPGLEESRSLWGFDPVAGARLRFRVSAVSVST